MMGPAMPPGDWHERWAVLLADYCLEVRPGQTVLIGGELAARPLIESCARAVIDRGAHPLLRVELPGLAEYFLERGDADQLGHCPPSGLFDAQHCDARLRIAAESDTRSMSRIDPQRQALVDRARHPIRDALRGKRWALTQYPTSAYAADAGMTLEAYEAFVAGAMFLDQPEPSAAWRELGRRQAGLAAFLGTVSTLRIEAEDTDLTLSVAGRGWINSDGKRNMPSGEVFSGPVENSVHGRFKCGFPVCRSGRELVGIALEFQDGKVVAAKADHGEDYLLAMLDLDAGARRLGEIGIGLNYGINRFTGSILYDEKIGGTIHVALGSSYPETGGVNASALHWDLILDTRKRGRVHADGRLVMEDGTWHVG